MLALQAGARHPAHSEVPQSRQRPPLQRLEGSTNRAADADKESPDDQKTVQVQWPRSLELYYDRPLLVLLACVS